MCVLCSSLCSPCVLLPQLVTGYHAFGSGCFAQKTANGINVLGHIAKFVEFISINGHAINVILLMYQVILNEVINAEILLFVWTKNKHYNVGLLNA